MLNDIKGASPQNIFDCLQKLAGVSTDSALAKAIGYTKQGISTARGRGKASMKLLAKASLALGIPLEDLQVRIGEMQEGSGSPNCVLGIQKNEQNENSQPSHYGDQRLWETLQLALQDNARLHKEKEDLLRENGELKAQVAKLSERESALLGGGKCLSGTQGGTSDAETA